jgi:hypothetical protein
MNIDDSKAIALLIIRWGNYETTVKASHKQDGTKGAEPGDETTSDFVKVLW